MKTVKILASDGENYSVADEAARVIETMKDFYKNLGIDVLDVLDFELEKFIDAGNRYAWKIREQFQDSYVKKALALAKERQETVNV